MSIRGERNTDAWFYNKSGETLMATTWNQRGYNNPMAVEYRAIIYARDIELAMDCEPNVTIIAMRRKMIAQTKTNNL